MGSYTAPRATGERSGLGPSSYGDRRRGPRVWVDLPVDMYVDALARRGRVVDVSVSGMVLELTEALADRKPYLFATYAIHAGGPRPVCVAARTVWRRGAMQASCFVALSDEQRAALGEMVKTALRRASEIVRLELAERRDRGSARARPAGADPAADRESERAASTLLAWPEPRIDADVSSKGSPT